MIWNLDVPKIFHVYWGLETLPYMRMLTVKSFMKHNPDWAIKLWIPKFPSVQRTWETRELNYPVLCEDCTPELMGLNIEINEVDFTVFGLDNAISEVHKSDFLRLLLLSTMGGVWSDMDIIYFRPITELAVNIPENKTKGAYVCIGGYGHSAGFLMSVANNAYYKELTCLAKDNIDPKKYQGIGATMFNERFPKVKDIEPISSVVNIDMDAVYAHDALHIPSILDGSPPKFTKYSIAIHWYAGFPAWGVFIKDTNGGKTDVPDSVIGKVLKSIA